MLSALDPTRKTEGKGGGGGLPASGPIQRAGGGGGGGVAVHLRPDTESGGGGGGGCCSALQARYKKRGRGRGCLAEEGALPYMKGGVATPKTPPPPPLDPPLYTNMLVSSLSLITAVFKRHLIVK